MKYGIFAILDKRAKSFGPPITVPTDTHAVRMFTGEISSEDKNNAVAAYPRDFELHKMGTLILDCDENGNVISNLSMTESTMLVTGEAIYSRLGQKEGAK